MKRKGIITIKNLEGSENNKYPFAVDFWGHNEGCGSPCCNEEEVKKEVDSLIKQHNNIYILEVKDERKKEEQKTLW